MISREYLARQAMTLMKLARLAKAPEVAAGLTAKAADLQDRSKTPSLSPNAPAIPSDEQNKLG